LRETYSQEEEEKEIREFELERLKQEMEIRGIGAAQQMEQRMQNYRRRAQEALRPQEDDMEVDMGTPIPIIPAQRPIQIRPQQEGEGEEEDMHDEGDNENEDNTQQNTFSGSGVRLGGEENKQEEEDPKAARMKWLEQMGEK
jgi:hypothetical protein